MTPGRHGGLRCVGNDGTLFTASRWPLRRTERGERLLDVVARPPSRCGRGRTRVAGIFAHYARSRSSWRWQRLQATPFRGCETRGGRPQVHVDSDANVEAERADTDGENTDDFAPPRKRGACLHHARNRRKHESGRRAANLRLRDVLARSVAVASGDHDEQRFRRHADGSTDLKLALEAVLEVARSDVRAQTGFVLRVRLLLAFSRGRAAGRRRSLELRRHFQPAASSAGPLEPAPPRPFVRAPDKASSDAFNVEEDSFTQAPS